MIVETFRRQSEPYDWEMRARKNLATWSESARAEFERQSRAASNDKSRAFLRKLVGILNCQSLFSEPEAAFDYGPLTYSRRSRRDFTRLVSEYSGLADNALRQNVFETIAAYIKSIAQWQNVDASTSQILNLFVRNMDVKEYKGIPLGPLLGAGGLSVVFAHPIDEALVLKIYFSRTALYRNTDIGDALARREYLIGKLLNTRSRRTVYRELNHPYLEVLTRERIPEGWVIFSDYLSDPHVPRSAKSAMYQSVIAELKYVLSDDAMFRDIRAIEDMITDGVFLRSDADSSDLDRLGRSHQIDLTENNIAVHPISRAVFLFDF